MRISYKNYNGVNTFASNLFQTVGLRVGDTQVYIELHQYLF